LSLSSTSSGAAALFLSLISLATLPHWFLYNALFFRSLIIEIGRKSSFLLTQSVDRYISWLLKISQIHMYCMQVAVLCISWLNSISCFSVTTLVHHVFFMHSARHLTFVFIQGEY